MESGIFAYNSNEREDSSADLKIAFIVTVIVLFSMTPIYRATATLMIEANEAKWSRVGLPKE